MRYLLLILTVLAGCGGSEAITEFSSPLGCWRSDSGELDLMGDGSWRQTFDVSPTTDSGSWTYDAGRRELLLSIANASSANGPALTMWSVTDLTPTEMWTAVGSTSTHWQTTACEVPVCTGVTAIATCGNLTSGGRLCAVCSGDQGTALGCHIFSDAAQGTGVTGPAATADYACVTSCGACL